MNVWEWLIVLAGVGAFVLGGIALAEASSIDSAAWRTIGGIVTLCGMVAFLGVVVRRLLGSRPAQRR